MFACPKCGKAESSFDGIKFCGACEEKYQREQATWEEQERAPLRDRVKSHADDCECALCTLAFRPWNAY